MDTAFFRQALEDYQHETGDKRDVSLLPMSVLSRLMMDAQRLKAGAFQAGAAPVNMTKRHTGVLHRIRVHITKIMLTIKSFGRNL